MDVILPAIGILAKANQTIPLLLAEGDQVEAGRQYGVRHEEIYFEIARLVAICLLVAGVLEAVLIVSLHNGPGGVTSTHELYESLRILIAPGMALLDGG